MWVNLKTRFENGVEIMIAQVNIPQFAFTHEVIIYGNIVYKHESNSDYFSCSHFDATNCKSTGNLTINSKSWT